MMPFGHSFRSLDSTASLFIMKGSEISAVSLFYHERLWDFYSEFISSRKASILTFDAKLNIYPIFGWVYTAGHGWGISCDFDVNCNVLQSWYNFTFSVKCKTLFRVGKEQYLVWFEYTVFLILIDPFNGNTVYSQMCFVRNASSPHHDEVTTDWSSSIWRVIYFSCFTLYSLKG